MPDTITVQIPAGYKGKVTIDVSDVEPVKTSKPSVPKPNWLTTSSTNSKDLGKAIPKIKKKMPKNWDSSLKPRGPDGRYIKEDLNYKKAKLDMLINHAIKSAENDSSDN